MLQKSRISHQLWLFCIHLVLLYWTIPNEIQPTDPPKITEQLVNWLPTAVTTANCRPLNRAAISQSKTLAWCLCWRALHPVSRVAKHAGACGTLHLAVHYPLSEHEPYPLRFFLSRLTTADMWLHSIPPKDQGWARSWSWSVDLSESSISFDYWTSSLEVHSVMYMKRMLVSKPSIVFSQ